MDSYQIKHDFLFNIDFDDALDTAKKSHKRLKRLFLSKLMSLRNDKSLQKLISKCRNNKIKIVDDIEIENNECLKSYKKLVLACFKQKFLIQNIPVIN